MWAFLRSAQQWMAGMRWLRRLGEAVFRNGARRRIVELDSLSVARCQQRILTGLVHHAQTTHFGRAHDFRRIRTPEDFRRLVPLRTAAAFWQDFWQPAFPDLADISWPGPLTCLAALGTASPTGLAYLPVTPDLWHVHQDVRQTVLGLMAHTRPGILRTSCLQDKHPEPERNGFSPPSTNGPVPVVPWEKLGFQAPGSVEGSRLESFLPPEGPVAVEDPRHGMLRLLVDHRVYFEFVPVTELNAKEPARYGASQVEPGVPYSLAMTSPAGLWACLTGARVCFERRDPPLLRLLETTLPKEQRYSSPANVWRSAVHPFPPQPPHVRSGKGVLDRFW